MSFLGMLNFNRRYLRGAASILKPLTDATPELGGKHSQLELTKEMEKAFAASKASALTDTAHLAHPIQEAELSMAVDASNHHVGAALQQGSPGGEWQPLSFFSRKLTNRETRYSTFDRQLLAVVVALHHFQFLLEGRKFHVMTDHKPLVFALHRARDAWSAPQGHHLAYMAEFTSDLHHLAGADNVVYPGGWRKGALRVAGGPCGTGWELRGLHNNSSSGPCYPAGAHQEAELPSEQLRRTC